MNYNPYARPDARGGHRRNSGGGYSPYGSAYRGGHGGRQGGGQGALISLVVSGVAALARQFQGTGYNPTNGPNGVYERATQSRRNSRDGMRDQPVSDSPLLRHSGLNMGIVVAGAVFLALALRFFLWWVLVYTCIVEPLFSTLRAMEDVTRDRERRWLTYWSFFALGIGVDFMLGSVGVRGLRASTAYPAILFFGLTWLRKNDAENAALLFENYLRPTALRNAPVIEHWHNEFNRATSSVARAIVDATNNHLEPYARREDRTISNEQEREREPEPEREPQRGSTREPLRARPRTRSQSDAYGDDIPGVVVQELD